MTDSQTGLFLALGDRNKILIFNNCVLQNAIYHDRNCPTGISSARRRWFDTVPPGAVGTFQLVTSSEVPVAFHLDPSWVNISPTAGQSAPLQAASVSIYQHESLRVSEILLPSLSYWTPLPSMFFCFAVQSKASHRVGTRTLPLRYTPTSVFQF